MRASSMEVSCVTPIRSGREPSPPISPLKAALIMCEPPAACTFTMSVPSRLSARMAFITVFGMSCSFRSRKILCPRSFIRLTMDGPSE